MIGSRLSHAFLTVVVIGCLATSSWGQHPADNALAGPTTARKITPESLRSRDVDPNHPLHRAIEMAEGYRQHIRNHVLDYTCILVKRERIDGTLLPHEYLSVKCRHPRTLDGQLEIPFSVYMKYVAPKKVVGREVLYVAGRDGDDMLVRRGGRRSPYMKVWLNPAGNMAMRENRYPLTEFGVKNLLDRLVEVAKEDLRHGECDVKYYQGAKVDGRICTGIEVRHPVPRKHFRFHVARVLVDDELRVPVHYSSYTWPEKTGDPPVLLEQYTYRDVRLNVGLTDFDFDRDNPEYGLSLD